MAARLLCRTKLLLTCNHVLREHCARIPVSKSVTISRTLMQIPPERSNKVTTKPTVERINPPSLIVQRIMNRFGKLLNRFEKILEKTPKLEKHYDIVKFGFVDLKKDFVTYYGVSHDIWEGKPLKEFSRYELEVYRQMPSQMRRAVPLLACSVLPGGFMIIPLAFTFPQLFLTTHFMTEEQRMLYEVRKLRKRLRFYPRVMDHMDIQANHLAFLMTYSELKTAVLAMEHGKEVLPETVMIFEELFRGFPFQTEKLHRSYAKDVGRMNGLSHNSSDLTQEGLVLMNTDLAMANEGIQNLQDKELQNACFMRGLNANGLEREEMIKYLEDWTTVSKCVRKNSASLLLHLPLFLAFNLPSNDRIMPKKWKQKKRIAKS